MLCIHEDLARQVRSVFVDHDGQDFCIITERTLSVFG